MKKNFLEFRYFNYILRSKIKLLIKICLLCFYGFSPDFDFTNLMPEYHYCYKLKPKQSI